MSINGDSRNIMANVGQPTSMLLGSRPVSNQVPTGNPARDFLVENNLVFSIFIFMLIPSVIYILLMFFTSVSGALNTYLFGIFKRPLPANPELYFDMNCINSMNLQDFMQPDQVQRCAAARPINRLGPPLSF